MLSEKVTGSFHRMTLVPSFIAKVKNWPSVFAARAGWTDVPGIRLRDGLDWRFVDLRPGLAMFKEIYLERAYDAPFRLEPHGTVVDLGANVGWFTVTAARDLVPCGRVIAVEPNPEVVVVLRRNLASNKVSNVEVKEVAVSAQDGLCELWLSPTSQSASMCRLPSALRSITIKTMSLEKLLSEAGQIELLKLDIEGAEWPILFDSAPQVWKRVKRIAMEYHLDMAARGTLADLVQRIHQLGYTSVQAHPLSKNNGYLWAENESALPSGQSKAACKGEES